EAYSHEVSSCGFWPGGGPVPFPAYYSYAYPTPDGFGAAPVRPSAAFFSRDLGEFVLPYDEVRRAAAPDAMLLAFLQSTYEAAAGTASLSRRRWPSPRISPGPRSTVLHRVVRENLETFCSEAADRTDGGGLPRFVEREFREFLTCGALGRGFARVRCENWAFE